MKQNDRVIRTGDYYELETFEDLMMQQKIVKKEEPQSATNIQAPPANIITTLPSRKEALSAYFVPASASIRSENFGVNEYQSSLQELLKQPIKDEERLEIEKLLKEIDEIKQDGQLPLNNIPQPGQCKKSEEAKSYPKQINLQAAMKIDTLKKQVSELEGLKFMELSRLEHLIDILLGELKIEATTPQASQLDQKIKAELEATYNNLNSLTCLKSLPAILNKIAANEIKFEEMGEWVSITEQISDLNKEVRDEFENDGAVLNQLQASFKQNVEKVRAAIKKLSE